jgi:hypothetical protein
MANMTKISLSSSIAFLTTTLVLSACGPETNSRYGDEHWDPQDTWEKASVVSQPELNVVYRDTDADPDDDVEDWEAYLSIDFTDLANIAISQVSFNYYQGTSSDQGIDAFLQNGASFSDTNFYYDTESGTDYRLQLDVPGDYNLKLELQIAQPNGTTRDYDFIYNDVIVPGMVTSATYYSTNVNATLGEYCVICHDSDVDATAEFELDLGNITTRRTNFLDKVNNPTVDKEILNYPFTEDHTGSASANSMTAEEKAYFQEYISLLVAEKTDNTADITDTNLEIKEIAKPSIMEDDPYAP